MNKKSPEMRPSRAQHKSYAKKRETLAVELSAFNAKELQGLHLPEELHKSLLTLLEMRAFGARKRQLKNVSGLVRNLNEEAYQAIHKAIAERALRHRAESLKMKKVEEWRTRLLDDPTLLERWLDRFGPIDEEQITEIQTLIRRTLESEANVDARRALFRLLREAMAT